MSLDLKRGDLPAKVEYTTADGGHGYSIVVFMYADGKILTTSALVMDPSGWTNVEIWKNYQGQLASPPWAGKTDKELTERFQKGVMLGRFVPDAHAPISESAEEVEIRESFDDRVRQNSVLPTPKTIRGITDKDEVSDEEFLGKEPA